MDDVAAPEYPSYRFVLSDGSQLDIGITDNPKGHAWVYDVALDGRHIESIPVGYSGSCPNFDFIANGIRKAVEEGLG